MKTRIPLPPKKETPTAPVLSLRQLAHRFVEVTGGSDRPLRSVQHMLTFMGQLLEEKLGEEATANGVTSEERERMRVELANVVEAGLASMEERFAAHRLDLIVRHYTATDLRGLIDFYESPLGQRTLAAGQLIEEESLSVNHELTNEVTASIMAAFKQSFEANVA